MNETDASSSASEIDWDRIARLPAAIVGDAQERLNVMHATIRTMWPGAKLMGRALTVLTVAGDNRAIHEALAQAQVGDVIVVNGQGDMSRALIGDLIGEMAQAAGVNGFVIDGCIRDAGDLARIHLPVFARGVTPAGPYKNGPGKVGRAVAVGGVVVNTGDIVVGDDDGVVVVPIADLADVLVSAEAKLAEEAEVRRSIRDRARS